MSGGLSNIFDLDTSLSVSGSSAYANYRQLAPSRNVTGGLNSFSGGPINFRFQTGSSVYVVPNRSYLRLRMRISKNVGGGVTNPVVLNDRVAPNINLGHNLFSSCEWHINDKTVSRIGDFIPQIGALHQRLNSSKNWRETTGRTTNFSNYSFVERQADIARDGRYLQGMTVETPLTSLMFPVTAEQFLAQCSGTLVFAANPNLQTLGTLTLRTVTVGNLTAVMCAQISALFVNRVGSWLTLENSATVAAGVFEIVSEPTLAVPGGNNAPFMTIQLRRPVGSTFYDTTAGNVTNTYTAAGNFGTRMKFIDRVPVDTRSAGEFELCFQLPLSIWDHTKGIPGGNHELVLNPLPASVLALNIIQAKIPGVTADTFSFEIMSMFMVVYEIKGPPVTNTEFLIDLETIRMQTETTIGQSQSQKVLDVSPTTYALAIAYQDKRVLNDARLSSSQFRFYNDDLSYEGSNALSRFYIQYAGQQFPSPDADPQLAENTAVAGAGTIDYTTERYMQTMIESGQYYQLAESLTEFRERGPFYYFLVPRDNTDRSTRVQINQAFADALNTVQLNAALAQTRLLLFDLSRQVCKITMEGGIITTVLLQDQ